MFQTDWGSWMNGNGSGAPLVRPRGGVAPLRHDLALADYIERQAALREARPAVGRRRVMTVEAVARGLAWLFRMIAGSRFRRIGGPAA